MSECEGRGQLAHGPQTLFYPFSFLYLASLRRHLKPLPDSFPQLYLCLEVCTTATRSALKRIDWKEVQAGSRIGSGLLGRDLWVV